MPFAFLQRVRNPQPPVAAHGTAYFQLISTLFKREIKLSRSGTCSRGTRLCGVVAACNQSDCRMRRLRPKYQPAMVWTTCSNSSPTDQTSPLLTFPFPSQLAAYTATGPSMGRTMGQSLGPTAQVDHTHHLLRPETDRNDFQTPAKQISSGGLNPSIHQHGHH
ncbi:hypothetical protein BKA81DRAFT_347364 [Phyllosticta paracitricarpa]